MSDSGGVRWKDVLPAVLFLRSVETINVCFFSFQSGVSSWATWGVHPGLHPGIEEVCPERHRLPPADIWSAGIPTGAAQRFCSSPLLSSLPPTHSFPLFWSCVRLSFAYASIFTLHLFSPLTPFQFPLFWAASFVLFPRSSSALPFHSPSLLFMRLRWWSAGVPESPHNHRESEGRFKYSMCMMDGGHVTSLGVIDLL